MPSALGLLEQREGAARQRGTGLQAELREAEAAWQRFVIACGASRIKVFSSLESTYSSGPRGSPSYDRAYRSRTRWALARKSRSWMKIQDGTARA